MNTQFYKLDKKSKKLIHWRKYAGRENDRIGFEYDEKYLEKLILSAPDAIYIHEYIIIGEQVPTDFGPLDLLGLDNNGDLLLIELKVGNTPRNIIAQVLEYATFINKKSEEILSLANKKTKKEIKKFLSKYNLKSINNKVKLIIVGGWIDNSIVEVSKYLMEKYALQIFFSLSSPVTRIIIMKYS